MTTLDTMRSDNLTTWLELEALRLGTDNQRERWSAGMLPEDELTALARTELFKGFAGFRRWSGRDRGALIFNVKHQRPCQQHGEHDIDLETTDATELGADDWNTLKRIQEMAAGAKDHPWFQRVPDAISIDIQSATHWATCRVCKAEAFRSFVKVTIRWAGRDLVREYAL